MSMNRETVERVAALLQRLLDAGSWHHSALEIDVHGRPRITATPLADIT